MTRRRRLRLSPRWKLSSRSSRRRRRPYRYAELFLLHSFNAILIGSTILNVLNWCHWLYSGSCVKDSGSWTSQDPSSSARWSCRSGKAGISRHSCGFTGKHISFFRYWIILTCNLLLANQCTPNNSNPELLALPQRPCWSFRPFSWGCGARGWCSLQHCVNFAGQRYGCEANDRNWLLCGWRRCWGCFL